ncbi:retrovirus-related Pol polyprotein from transposon TNT 1-94 [Castanea sativa]|uniref:retrovirus-related Pol polyprotein from transposon TNT 1-94 n=1 Tax=Castanea sativa TaxID=21020 RepID=UPI003F653D75
MDEEEREKIEKTVVDILRNSNLDHITEFKLRLQASKRLGIDLFENDLRKAFVRTVLENFLLDLDLDDDDDDKPQNKHRPNSNGGGAADRVICKLSNKRNVVISDFRGKALVSIREFYEKDGKQLPAAKGISLSPEQWSVFRKNVPAIEDAVIKMELKLRSQLDGKQIEDLSNTVSDIAPQEVPFETDRFNGKNYHCWARQMESFLTQLNISYVLANPCPSVTLSPEATTAEIAQAKLDEQKWVKDDYICRCNILSSLSDPLFYKYSKRAGTAKELWKELELVYLYEEFGTKRSQVKKYIDFQMVEERPIVEQVLEFNSIADSIVAAGMLIEENFHVSVIISKLPPSWKDFCIKVICEEYLPFYKLMDHLRIEEETRNQGKQGDSSNLLGNQVWKFRPNIKPPNMRWNRREQEMDGKPLVCHNCGKKGHLSRNCRKKFVKENSGNGVVDNVSMPVVAEVNMVGGTME